MACIIHYIEVLNPQADRLDFLGQLHLQIVQLEFIIVSTSLQQRLLLRAGVEEAHYRGKGCLRYSGQERAFPGIPREERRYSREGLLPTSRHDEPLEGRHRGLHDLLRYAEVLPGVLWVERVCRQEGTALPREEVVGAPLFYQVWLCLCTHIFSLAITVYNYWRFSSVVCPHSVFLCAPRWLA